MQSAPEAERHSQHSGWKHFLFPFLIWLPKITKETIRGDILAGFTGAIIALPQGVAFAAIAGMPPQYGLYSGMVPAIIAALFGSSWLLVSGPTTAASLLLFSSLSLHAQPGTHEYVQLALTLTLIVGCIQLSLGLVRFGSLVNFISHSVIVGFTSGAAILIIVSQVKHFLGLNYPRAAAFHDTVHALFLHMAEANPYAVAVGCITLLTGMLIRLYRPSLPYMIISMLIGSLSSVAITFAVGKEASAIMTVGALPASLPPISFPTLTLDNLRILIPTALAMTLFALTEAISIARSLADKTDQTLDGNQEFIGQGLSNIVGSFFSGYVATGSFNRSGMNYEAGAKTPLAAICAGFLLMPIVFVMAPLCAYLPNAAMAAILFLVAWRLIDLKHILTIARTSRSETVILASTFVATLFLELQFAILLGILLSLAIYLNRTSHPKVLTRVPDSRLENRPFVTDPHLPECPQLKIIRIDGSLYFGAVNHVRNLLKSTLGSENAPKNLLLVGSGINFIDMEGAEYLLHLAKEREEAGGHLYFYDMKEGICNNMKFTEYLLGIGIENIFATKREAITEIYQVLDKKLCGECDLRIFQECGMKPVTAGTDETQSMS